MDAICWISNVKMYVGALWSCFFNFKINIDLSCWLLEKVLIWQSVWFLNFKIRVATRLCTWSCRRLGIVEQQSVSRRVGIWRSLSNGMFIYSRDDSHAIHCYRSSLWSPNTTVCFLGDLGFHRKRSSRVGHHLELHFWRRVTCGRAFYCRRFMGKTGKNLLLVVFCVFESINPLFISFFGVSRLQPPCATCPPFLLLGLVEDEVWAYYCLEVEERA